MPTHITPPGSLGRVSLRGRNLREFFNIIPTFAHCIAVNAVPEKLWLCIIHAASISAVRSIAAWLVEHLLRLFLVSDRTLFVTVPTAGGSDGLLTVCGLVVPGGYLAEVPIVCRVRISPSRDHLK